MWLTICVVVESSKSCLRVDRLLWPKALLIIITVGTYTLTDFANPLPVCLSIFFKRLSDVEYHNHVPRSIHF